MEDLCRHYRTSQGTFYKYKYKWKYGGMEPSDSAGLRALEAENGKLKKLLAETTLLSRRGGRGNSGQLLR